jgi:hypothetical protein
MTYVKEAMHDTSHQRDVLPPGKLKIYFITHTDKTK